MGFLNKTVFAKRLNKTNLFVLAMLAGIISCGLAISSSTFAAEVVDNYGLFTASDGARWEWEVVSDSENTEEPQKLNLMFYDKPENLTTVTMPSYTDITTVSGVTPASDTYYVKNANQESQDTRFTNPDPARRTGGQDVTVLDMTNTSKVQILGVKPIINPNTEVELIFGENMVIGDANEGIHVSFTVDRCVEMEQDPNYGRRYDCTRTEPVVHENVETIIPGWDSFTQFEKTRYQASETDILDLLGCRKITDTSLTVYSSLSFTCYVTGTSFSVTKSGVFSGNKLKITNLDNVKYLGWYAFSDSTFNENSRSVIIRANQTAGEGVFENTNINSVSFEGDTTYPAMFRGCMDLTLDNIQFNDVETVSYSTFENTNLGSIDFRNTNIKTILGQAFKNANLTSINIDGIKKLDFEAFANNHLTELFLPKSLEDINTAGIVSDNAELTKLTVAYDTMRAGASQPLHSVLDKYCDFGRCTHMLSYQITDLTVLAPYGEDEQVASDHMLYEASTHLAALRNENNREHFEYDYINTYGNASRYKNVIAPGYFYAFPNLENITIGEGYEFIGANAFYERNHGKFQSLSGNELPHYAIYYSKTEGLYDKSFHVTLPETLKGIGTNAFAMHREGDFSINLPESLEYIGRTAFKNCIFMYNDLDLPSLKFIGTQAFYVTGLKNIYLHDSLEFVGFAPFQNVWMLDNVTFDYDVFGLGHIFDGSYEEVSYTSSATVAMFGSSNGTWSISSSDADYPFYEPDRVVLDGFGWYYHHKVKNITFTEKAVSEIRVYGNPSDYGYSPFFSLAAEKVDMSRTPWKILPSRSFLGANIGEILLPESLEYIGDAAFMHTDLEEELVLPDSIKVIDCSAFSNYKYVQYLPTFYDSEGGDPRYDHGVKITKLPASLEYVGGTAFYGDFKMEADLDAPNLKVIGNAAFMKTSIKNIHLYDKLTAMYSGAFLYDMAIEDITIDVDIFTATSSPSYSYEYGGYGSFRIAGDYVSTPMVPDSNGYYFGAYFGEKVSQNYYAGNDKMECIDLWNWQWYSRMGDIVLTEKVPQPTKSGWFSFIAANSIDISQTKWTTVPVNTFMNVSVKSFYLSDTIKTIDYAAFLLADIKSELILPDSIEVIVSSAFNNYEYANTLTYNYSEEELAALAYKNRSIIITKLPSSLREVGAGAFYGDLELAVDFDLPNLEIIGAAAFMKTALHDVALRDKIVSIGRGAFDFIPTLHDITLDLDFYGAIGGGSFYGIFGTVGLNKTYKAQSQDGSTFHDIVFTDKNITNPIDYSGFAFLNANKIDISNVLWTTISKSMFYSTELDDNLIMSSSIKTIDDLAFQWSSLGITNGFAEGLETIGKSAFYGADIYGDLIIPSTVTSIGWSAFNAGDTDTHYGTVTIKPALNYDSTDSQAVFQMFWNASMDKLVIESPMLPVLAATGDNPVLPHEVQYNVVVNDVVETITINPTLRADGEPEFHAMTMREVEIKNLPTITANAFEECANLEKVSFVEHDNLQEIGKFAFSNDNKLKKIVFGDSLVNKEVALKEYAFNNTAIESLGTTNDSDFNLAAANFHTVQEHVFSNMSKLKAVDIPNNFNIDENLANETKNVNGSHITSFTFSDDPELEQVTIGYQVSEIRDGAFLNDEKLAKLFVWGNAEIQESDQLIQDFNNTTIPKGTTIFAYSDAPAESYANAESRDEYAGEFYALDEVLAIAANRNVVILNEDKTDFDKTGLKLYAQRRDGVILESDWKEYNTAFTRTNRPEEAKDITFEEGRGRVGSDEADIASQIFDAPKPFDTISLTNKNFKNVDYEFLTMPTMDPTTNANPLVLVHYPDGYTGNIRNTTLVTKTVAEIIEEIITPDPEPTEEPESETKPTPKPEEKKEETQEELSIPDTGAFGALVGAATSSLSIATVIVLGAIFLMKKRK